MKNNKLYIAKVVFLLLLSTAVVVSSIGAFHSSSITKAKTTKEEKKKENEEKVSVAHGLEAVVVSFINPDFAKYVLFSFFDFSPKQERSINTLRNFILSGKHFHTLFTNIISPNAP